MGSPGGANDKELTHQLGDLREKGPISGWRRSLRRGHSKPLQYSCLENPHRQRSPVGYSPWGSQKSQT